MSKPQVVNGTSYHPDTPKELIDILEKLRQRRSRVRVHYGYTTEERRATVGSDKAVGEDWLEENDVYGIIGRSTGTIKIPLVVAIGEDGGCGLLDQCIIRIRASNGKDLYRHPKYHHKPVTIIPIIHGSGHHVMVNNEVHVTYESKKLDDNTKAKCEAWVKKMGLTLS